jgi:hypothetical protein
MPAQHPHQPVSVDSPAAMLAVVPHLLGFTPTRSLVIAGGRGPRHRIGATLRFDLPDPPDAAIADAIAAHTVPILTRHEFTTVVVIGYGPGELVTPLTDVLRKAITPTGIEIRDMLRVQDGRYWSYLCTNPACCPPAGVPFDPARHPAAAALTLASGQHVLASRDDLAATVAPVTGPVAETMRRETTRAQQTAARLIARATTTGGSARPVTRAGLNAMQTAITTYRDGGTIELASQLAWLTVALTSLWVRDDAWARMHPAHAHAHQRLWTDLTRHAQPGFAAAPASLLAFVAWQTGNGALANVALDRALADTPGYSMAQLLRQTIDAGTPPSLARLPMTPEEVAASYSGPPGSEQVEQWRPGASGTGDDSAS